MLFLLNKPERFTCTVQQSKAKANKRDINPSYCVNQLHFHDVQCSAILTSENKLLAIYALGSVRVRFHVGTGPNCCQY